MIYLKSQNGSVCSITLDQPTHSIITNDTDIVAMDTSEETTTLYILIENGTRIMALYPNGTRTPVNLKMEKTGFFKNIVTFSKCHKLGTGIFVSQYY